MVDRPTAFARGLRRNAPATERLLWRLLRDRRLENLKFRRQAPLGRYVADFVCLRHRLIVEADGPHHQDSLTDDVRDAWLRGQGFRVMRFTNGQIQGDPNRVLGLILDAIAVPLSPLAGEGVSGADG